MQRNRPTCNSSKINLKKLIDGFWLNPEDDNDSDKWLNKIDAIIRIAFKENPEELTDEQWAKRFQEWNYVNRLQLATQEAMLKKVLLEVANKIFKALNDSRKKT